MSKNTVIFDLDGTLLNTLEDLTDSTNNTLNAFDFPSRTISEVRRFVGNGIYKLVERAVPESTSPEIIKKCFDYFCVDYKKNMANKTRPYDGIDELLETLYKNNFKMAIVTNKADFAAQELCGNLFGKYVDVVVGSDGVRPNKPAPDSVLLALEKLNSVVSDAVYIGDSEVDAATAANSNMDCIGVLWGFRDRKDLETAGVDIMVENTEKLAKKLLFLKNN